jgi:hypothetical protein
MNVQSVEYEGTRIISGITPVSQLQLSGSSGTLQNLIVTETAGNAMFAILYEGTAGTPPPNDTGFVFAFPVAANGVAHLKAPIKFTGGLWLMLRATMAVAGTARVGVVVANIAG